jgi:hypothetical protein
LRKAIDHITLNPSAIARVLGTVALLLVFANIGGQLAKFWLGHDYVKGLVPLFYVDTEQNIPTFFSVLLLLFAALLLAAIAVLNRKQRTPHVSKWAILSFGFLYMAYDEALHVHERLISPVRTLVGDGNLGVFYFAWVIPGIALVFILALLFLRFLLHLPATARLRFLMAATLYIGGAIGVELVGGRYAELHGMQNWTYSMIVTVEESLEMAGLIVFIWALLKYCADNYKEVRFRFDA